MIQLSYRNSRQGKHALRSVVPSTAVGSWQNHSGRNNVYPMLSVAPVAASWSTTCSIHTDAAVEVEDIRTFHTGSNVPATTWWQIPASQAKQGGTKAPSHVLVSGRHDEHSRHRYRLKSQAQWPQRLPYSQARWRSRCHPRWFLQRHLPAPTQGRSALRKTSAATRRK